MSPTHLPQLGSVVWAQLADCYRSLAPPAEEAEQAERQRKKRPPPEG